MQIHLNGVSDTLKLNLSTETEQLLKGSFTFEFDFISPRLPKDHNSHYPGISGIEIFSALDAKGKESFSFILNQYNRFTVTWFNSEGKRHQIWTTWNYPNDYELASIQRNKWYKVSLVNQKNRLELYIDGEKLGEIKTTGNLRDIKSFRFGGNLKGNRKAVFSGGIDNISLTSRILHNKVSDSVARKKVWQCLHDLANKDLKPFLLPENPAWAGQTPADYPYHILDMSWTALLMLRWHDELDSDQRLLNYAKKHGDARIIGSVRRLHAMICISSVTSQCSGRLRHC